MYVHCTVEHLLKAYSSNKNKKKNKQKTCCRPRSLSNFDRTPYPDTSLGSALCNSHYSLFSSFFFFCWVPVRQAGRPVRFSLILSTVARLYQMVFSLRGDICASPRHTSRRTLRPRNVKGQREPTQLNCTL